MLSIGRVNLKDVNCSHIYLLNKYVLSAYYVADNSSQNYNEIVIVCMCVCVWVGGEEVVC